MKVNIFEKDLGNGSKLAILIGGFDDSNPKGYMDQVVTKYVGSSSYNEFIDSHLDNPWIRVVLTGINDQLFNEQDI